MKTCKICGLTLIKLTCTDEANCLNISLEEERRAMSNWNKGRANSEANGLKKYYKLKETFKKSLPILLLILSSYNSKSQNNFDETKKSYPVIGFSSGYSLTHKSLNAGLQFGYRVDKIYVSSDMIIPLTTNVFVPFIFAVNLGVNLSQFQPFISVNYSTIGAESVQAFKGTPNEFISGLRLGYGIRYYFKSIPLNLNVMKQGKEFITSLSIYKAL